MRKLIIVLAVIALSFGSNADAKDNLLGKLGNALAGAVSNKQVTPDDLVGTWKYDSPAISFKSDNALKKIGGAAASSAVESKLKPFYDKAGMSNLVLTVAADHTFTMKMKLATIKGRIEQDENGSFFFVFSVFNKINLGKVAAAVTKSGSNVDITFDASRVIGIIDKVSKVANNSTFKAISSLLSSYDGLYAGFTLSKQ